MYRISLVLIVLFFNLIACKSQNVGNEVVDPVYPSCYKVLRDNPYVALPDSLGGKKYKGIAFVEGIVDDSTLQVTNVRIMKLRLETINGRNYIDYYHGIDSVSSKSVIFMTQQYLPFFKYYLNTLKIEKIKGGDPRSNIITLPIRFD